MRVRLIKTAAALLLVAGLLIPAAPAREYRAAEAPAAGETGRAVLSAEMPAVPGGGLTPAAENAVSRLYFDHATGGFAVENLRTGHMYHSTPVNAENDAKAADSVKQDLMSPVKLTYYNLKGRAEGEMTSYKEAVLLEQVSYFLLENGLRVNMTIGRAEQRVLLPKQILVDVMEDEIIGKLSTERRQRQMRAFYLVHSLEGLSEADADALTTQFPGVAYGDLYVLKSDAGERDIKMLEEYVKETGYTYERLEEDYEMIGFSEDAGAFPSFSLSADYLINPDGSLSCEIDAAGIRYDTELFMLTRISFLRYFGAGETGEEGYMFLPDGSGTVINFNNDGAKTILYTTGRVYGPDYAITQTRRGSFKQEFRFPVFGVKTNDSAVFGVIEKGDAVAEITCEMGNILHSYNAAYATFIIRARDSFVPDGAFELEPWILYEKEGYTGKIGLRYYFLQGENANYMGMARAYRGYLTDKGALAPMAAGEDLPFFMDSIAAVKVDKRVFGIPMYVPVSMTSTVQAEEMIRELTGGGVRNITMRYKSWYGNTYYNSAPIKLKINKDFGGEKGLKNLNAAAAAYGAEIVPDVEFMFGASTRKTGGRFSLSRDTSKNLFQKLAFKAELNVATLVYYSDRYIIPPARMVSMYDSFMKGYDKLGMPGVSLGSLGDGLSSDFKNTAYINRQDAQAVMVSLLQRSAEKYGRVIIDAGNAYALPYAEAVLNVPVMDSGFNISDETVPFMQAVLHGSVYYAGKPINLADNWKQAILRAAEYGEVPYFALNYEDGRVLKQAYIYDEIYSLNYQDWKGIAAGAYKTMNDALKPLANVAISGHSSLRPGVAATTYENGARVIVNYLEEPFNADGVTVGAEDFVVLP